MAGIIDVLGGAATGASWASPVGAGLSLLPTAAKFITGIGQRRRANRINPTDPGFQANTGILDNQRIVNDFYNNYQLPGKGAIQNQLASNYATNVADATQAATSSGDVLDAITKLGYGQNQAINSLGIQEAQQKNDLLPLVLQSNTAAGNELVRRNQFDENRYQQQLREKAALLQGGAMNTYGAADDLATLGGTLLNYRAQPWASSNSSVSGIISDPTDMGLSKPIRRRSTIQSA